MAKEQKTEVKKQLQPAMASRWVKVIVVLAIIIGIPFVVWGVAEFSYQQHVNRLSSVLSKFGQDSLESAGSVVESSPGASADCRHWLNTLYPGSGPCPGVGADWFVAIAPGQESAFVTDALSKAGYTVNVNPQSEYKPDFPFQAGHGTKQGYGVGLSLNPLGSQKPPYAAPNGTRWLQLFLSVGEVKAN